MGCPRCFCDGCGEEMIHRDHRKHYESSSALGQILYREGPSKISLCDVDLVSRKGLADGSTLLRIVEHKQPTHRGVTQAKILDILDGTISHCVCCTAAAHLKLHERSGVYIMRGHIAGATNGNRPTRFASNQVMDRIRDGKKIVFESHEAFFQFLDPESLLRRSKD